MEFEPRIRISGMALGFEPSALFCTTTMPGVTALRAVMRLVFEIETSSSPLTVVTEPVNVLLLRENMPLTTTSSICVPPSLSFTLSPFIEPVTTTWRVSMPRNPTSSRAGLVLVVKEKVNSPFSSVETPCPDPFASSTVAPGSTVLFES